MNQFHDFHLKRLENESWDAYEERLLAILGEIQGTAAYNAILDLVEMFVRKQFALAMSCTPDELLEKQLSAKVGMRLYTAISAVQHIRVEPTDEQIADFSSRMPDMDVLSTSRFAAARQRKATAAAVTSQRKRFS